MLKVDEGALGLDKMQGIPWCEDLANAARCGEVVGYANLYKLSSRSLSFAWFP
jgi:hypothetical protein